MGLRPPIVKPRALKVELHNVGVYQLQIAAFRQGFLKQRHQALSSSTAATIRRLVLQSSDVRSLRRAYFQTAAALVRS